MQECETNGWLGLSYEAETEVEMQTWLWIMVKFSQEKS